MSIAFSYWRGRKEQEVDIIAAVSGRLVPFEVKYRSQNVQLNELRGLTQFCQERKVDRGYVITRDTGDFGILDVYRDGSLKLLKIPAPLVCYWLGRSELEELQV